MLLATQYYRPPFPRRDYWRDDLREIRDAGLDAVYLWATWAWIEPEPGRYVYDDFDEIVDEAARNDLDVIMTTGTELHPYWIHRVVPDSEYVDHRAQRVVSSTLSYSNTGLAPGGCWDHPGVAERIGMFQEDIGRHFAGAANLLAWDCWNEFRGPVQSDGFVCHCEHTQRAFREWLADKYGDLAGLNAAWQQRFSDWDDVRVPKLPKRSWTEMIEYQQFLEWRSAEHLSVRAARIRDGDPSHPVLAHSVVLSPVMVGGESEYEQALCRGNDWEMANASGRLRDIELPRLVPHRRARVRNARRVRAKRGGRAPVLDLRTAGRCSAQRTRRDGPGSGRPAAELDLGRIRPGREGGVVLVLAR